MKQKQAHLSRLGTGLFSFLCIVYVLPIVVVLMNSFKKKSYISLEPFQLPNETTLTGLDNYTAAIDLHVRLVYYPGEDPGHQSHLHPVRLLHGSPLPDGHVHSLPGHRPAGSGHPLGSHHHLLGLWRGAGGVHVLRLCQVHPH